MRCRRLIYVQANATSFRWILYEHEILFFFFVVLMWHTLHQDNPIRKEIYSCLVVVGAESFVLREAQRLSINSMRYRWLHIHCDYSLRLIFFRGARTPHSRKGSCCWSVVVLVDLEAHLNEQFSIWSGALFSILEYFWCTLEFGMAGAHIIIILH